MKYYDYLNDRYHDDNLKYLRIMSSIKDYTFNSLLFLYMSKRKVNNEIL